MTAPEAGGKVTRRQFFVDAGRYLVAALLAGGVGALVKRSEETCINQGICNGCSAFSDCHLPQALSAREATMRRPQ
jgi:hypothetical protein